MSHLSDQERFLFDLKGFIVLRDVLPREQVARMQRDMDAHGIAATTNDPFRSRFTAFLDWSADWSSLIDHPRILPVLHDVIGEKFRLDHAYGMAMRAGADQGGEGLHHEAGLYDYGCYYTTHGSRMHNGLVVVSFALCDVPAGAGGFCCIPGTHKSLYPVPEGWMGQLDLPHIEHVPLSAGDAVVFTEALTHGTKAWTLTAYERRAALLKYTPGYMTWARNHKLVSDPSALSPRQRAIIDGPGVAGRKEVMAVG